MSRGVFLNAIGTAWPRHDCQRLFVEMMGGYLAERERGVFERLVLRSQIERRFSCLSAEEFEKFFPAGREPFMTTGVRMGIYKERAAGLAIEAARKIVDGDCAERITHVVVGSCTGFYAPGVDFDLIRALGLQRDVQRRTVGFMGCYAGLSVLQTAWEIVKASPESRVLTVNVELCSLHLQKPGSLEQVMGFAQFADGCAAAIVSSEEKGLRVQGFGSCILDAYAGAITWDITDQGFEMYLDAKLPAILMQHFPTELFVDRAAAGLWAIHPGGRSILDVVQRKLGLSDEAMGCSRGVLRGFGNMSSATVLFVLKELMEKKSSGVGYAMAFGPGLAVEGMRFSREDGGG